MQKEGACPALAWVLSVPAGDGKGGFIGQLG